MSRAGAPATPVDEVEVWLDDASLGGRALVGHLQRRPSRSGDTLDFAYADGWVDGRGGLKPFALDPQLRLHAGPQRARAGTSELTGAFIDCSPDRWGKKLMDRREVIAAREAGRKPSALRGWDYTAGRQRRIPDGRVALEDDRRAIPGRPCADCASDDGAARAGSDREAHR